MIKLFPLKGKIQNYEWGGKEYIPNLLGEEVSGVKCAEYWLGAHANAPSELQTENGSTTLDSFLNENLNDKLGAEIANKFGRLPFLFKVLDVNDVLSIQVHPTKIEAEKGYKRENDLGIAKNAPNRNYKDDNHKPEIMVALSEFWLLHGFLTEDKLKTLLANTPEFKYLLPIFETEGYYGLYKEVMEQTQEVCNKTLQSLIDRILPLYQSGKLKKSNPDYWAAKAVATAKDPSILDKGIYSIYFFNVVKANKGEAVFQDAGIPHAYLEGQNMELMANSDNVLRGGLTPKHVDVKELLKHVVFEETVPNIMQGELQNDGIERIYKSPAPDFELSQLILNNTSAYSSTSKTAEILIVIEGEVEVVENKTSLKLGRGDTAVLVADSSYKVTTISNAILYKATTP
jgi:mannose-6-phosphate isomerase